MGKYALQRRHPNVRIPHPLRPALPSLPVPRLLDPNVSSTPPSHLFYQAIVPTLKPCRFVPADALWNLAMAINVYLTLFKKYNAHALKAQEWKYFLLCYGCTFLIAFALLFVDEPSRGKVYGSAVVRFFFPLPLTKITQSPHLYRTKPWGRNKG